MGTHNYFALALNNPARGENEVFTPEQKSKIYALTTELYSNNEVDLTLTTGRSLRSGWARCTDC